MPATNDIGSAAQINQPVVVIDANTTKVLNDIYNFLSRNFARMQSSNNRNDISTSLDELTAGQRATTNAINESNRHAEERSKQSLVASERAAANAMKENRAREAREQAENRRNRATELALGYKTQEISRSLKDALSYLKDFGGKVFGQLTEMSRHMRLANLSKEDKDKAQQAAYKIKDVLKTINIPQMTTDTIQKFNTELIDELGASFNALSTEQQAMYAAMRKGGVDIEKARQLMQTMSLEESKKFIENLYDPNKAKVMSTSINNFTTEQLSAAIVSTKNKGLSLLDILTENTNKHVTSRGGVVPQDELGKDAGADVLSTFAPAFAREEDVMRMLTAKASLKDPEHALVYAGMPGGKGATMMAAGYASGAKLGRSVYDETKLAENAKLNTEKGKLPQAMDDLASLINKKTGGFFGKFANRFDEWFGDGASINRVVQIGFTVIKFVLSGGIKKIIGAIKSNISKVIDVLKRHSGGGSSVSTEHAKEVGDKDSDQFKEIVQNVKNSAKSAFGAFKSIAKNVKDRVQSAAKGFMSIASNLKDRIKSSFSGLQSAASNLKDRAKDAFSKFNFKDAIINLKEKSKNAFNGIQTAAANLKGKIKEKFDGFSFKDVALKMSGNFKNASELLKNKVSSAFDSIKSSAANLKESAKNAFDNFKNGFKNVSKNAGEGFKSIAQKFKQVSGNLGGSIKNTFSHIKQVGKETFINIGKRGIAAMSKVPGVLKGAAGKVGGAAKTVGKGLAIGAGVIGLIGALANLDQLKPVFENFKNSIEPAITNLIDSVVPVIGNVLNQLTPVINSLLTSLIPIVKNLLDDLVPVVESLLTALIPIVNTLLNALVPVINTLINIVTPILNLLMPILQGIIDAFVPILNSVMIVLEPVLEVISGVLAPILSLIGLILEPLGPLFEMTLVPIAKLLALILKPLQWLIDKIPGFNKPKKVDLSEESLGALDKSSKTEEIKELIEKSLKENAGTNNGQSNTNDELIAKLAKSTESANIELMDALGPSLFNALTAEQRGVYAALREQGINIKSAMLAIRDKDNLADEYERALAQGNNLSEVNNTDQSTGILDDIGKRFTGAVVGGSFLGPFGAVVGAIAGPGIIDAIENNEAINSAKDKFISGFNDIASWVTNKLPVILSKAFSKVGEFIKSIPNKVANVSRNIRDFLLSLPKKLLGYVESLPGRLFDGVVSMLPDDAASFVTSIKDKIISYLPSCSDIMKSVKTFIGSIFKKLKSLSLKDLANFVFGGTEEKEEANGGVVNNPTNALIGEAGKEVILPLTRPGRIKEILGELNDQERILLSSSLNNINSTKTGMSGSINSTLSNKIIEGAAAQQGKKYSEIVCNQLVEAALKYAGFDLPTTGVVSKHFNNPRMHLVLNDPVNGISPTDPALKPGMILFSHPFTEAEADKLNRTKGGGKRKAGDPGHMGIYAGNGLWWNSTSAKKTVDYSSGQGIKVTDNNKGFGVALTKPFTKKQDKIYFLYAAGYYDGMLGDDFSVSNEASKSVAMPSESINLPSASSDMMSSYESYESVINDAIKNSGTGLASAINKLNSLNGLSNEDLKVIIEYIGYAVTYLKDIAQSGKKMSPVSRVPAMSSRFG